MVSTKIFGISMKFEYHTLFAVSENEIPVTLGGFLQFSSKKNIVLIFFTESFDGQFHLSNNSRYSSILESIQPIVQLGREIGESAFIGTLVSTRHC